MSTPARQTTESAEAAEQDHDDPRPTPPARTPSGSAPAIAIVARGTVGREVPGHAQHRLGDDRDRDELEAVQEPVARRAFQRALSIGEQRSCAIADGSVNPAQAARPPSRSGAHEPDREAGLAAGRPRQELPERDDIGISALVEPRPPHDELAAEVAEMRDWPAETGQAKLEKDAEDFAG